MATELLHGDLRVGMSAPRPPGTEGAILVVLIYSRMCMYACICGCACVNTAWCGCSTRYS